MSKEMRKTKVLIVDDSAFMRKVITDILRSHPKIEIAGVARNGKDALEKLLTLQPDVITLDVEMPVMDGLEALKKIMRTRPTPVVMLSSTTKNGAENTVLAMESGAIDFIAKPGGAISLNLELVKDEIIEKVLGASKVAMRTVSKRLPAQKPTLKNTRTPKRSDTMSVVKPTRTIAQSGQQKSSAKFSTSNKTILAIGTSTGGPRALQEVLTNLPKNIAAPILIVQHMPVGFTKSLADRLNKLSAITVKEVEDRDILEDGVAYIAPGGKHFKVRKLGASLFAQLDEQDPPRAGHRPSVDVLFESIARISNVKCLAVVMTGMGHDGMVGVKQLKASCETLVIAESSETSVVYGMPRAIVEEQLADEVLNLENIATAITDII